MNSLDLNTQTATLFRRLLSIHPRWLWLMNLVLGIGSLLWLVLDPALERTVREFTYDLSLLKAGESPRDVLDIRSTLLIIECMTVLAVNASLVMSLLWGSQRSRTLKSWLAFATIICCWLAVGSNWLDVAWWGKQQRISHYVAEFETAARELRANWPSSDGTLSSTGPFMAYPAGDPAILVLLTMPELSLPATSFSVVERDDRGGLRFELVGQDQGAWVEWHPPGRQPTSFKGGLSEWHELDRFWSLADDWYLVRYLPEH